MGVGRASRASHAVENGFRRVGTGVAGHPWKTLGGVMLVAFACAAGLIEFEIETSDAKLWAPQNSPSVGYKRRMDSLFGFRDRTSYFYAEPHEGGSVLTKSRLLDFHDAFDAVNTLVVSESGTEYRMVDLCRRAGVYEPYASKCTMTSVLQWWDYNRTRIEDDPDVIGTLQSAPEIESYTGQALSYSMVLGGAVYSSNGTLESAGALLFSVALLNNASISEVQDRSPAEACFWELEYGRAMMKRTFGDLTTFPFSKCYERSVLQGSLDDDIYLMILDYALMLCFASFVMSTGSWLTSKASLALPAVGFVLLAMVAACGLGSAIGIQYSAVVQLLGFLLLGLGIDDAFVIVQSYRQSDPGLASGSRIGATMATAGASITVTSLSDMGAFLSGLTNSLPVIRAVCAFGTLGVLFDYAFQVTGFVAMLVFAHRREEDGRADGICCVRVTEPEQTCRGKPLDRAAPSTLQRFLLTSYPDFILSKLGKTVVVLTALLFFGFAAYGAPQIEADYRTKWLIPSNSPLRETLRIADDYFGGTFWTVTIATGAVDYSDLEVQAAMHELDTAVEGVTDMVSCRGWSEDFKAYYSSVHGNETTPDGLAPSDRYFVWLGEFLEDDGRAYTTDILNTSEVSATSIIATRFTCYTVRGDLDGKRSIRIMDNTVATAAELAGTLDSFAYSPRFLFIEGLKVMKRETLVSMSIAATLVFLICLLLLGNASAAVLVFVMVALTDLCLLAAFFYIGLTLEYVSALVLVLAIGFSVDYSAHIAHAFLHSRGATGDDKARDALGMIGKSVLCGGFSTWLAVALLPLSTSYLFRQVLFWSITFTVGFGGFHGVVLLPVLLSLFHTAAAQCGRGALPDPADTLKLGRRDVMNPLYLQTDPGKIDTKGGIAI
eukprot:m.128708 g.128708  ORF g.128708 m.128708 type:complete len:889 (+) comp13634_c0_seq2:238-2904(+)